MAAIRDVILPKMLDGPGAGRGSRGSAVDGYGGPVPAGGGPPAASSGRRGTRQIEKPGALVTVTVFQFYEGFLQL